MAIVDDLSLIAESAEGNNLLTLPINVSATNPGTTNVTQTLPDLVITNLTASLLYPVAGSPLVFRAWVRNQGSAPTSTNLHVLFHLDDGPPVTWSDTVTPLQPGETRIIVAAGGLNQTNRRHRNAWLAQPGHHKITAAIDIANHVVEQNESNNTFDLNLTIARAEAPLLSVTTPRGFTTEATNGTRLFTFTRRGATNDDLRVNFAVGGTAQNGIDYLPIGSSVLIPAGATRATVTFTPQDDDTVERVESVTLVLLPSVDYKVNRSAAATLFIRDTDLDTDHDGVTDHLESLAGTNPRDPLSH